MTESSAPAVPGRTLNPYQGLRPFQPSDWRFFCGRSTHVGEILQRLQSNRFVSVVGLSGSGKSSLVRAGVIPELLSDRLKGTTSDWLVALTTPGTKPLTNLAVALGDAVRDYFKEKKSVGEEDLQSADEVEAWAEAVSDALNIGSLGFVNAIETAGLPERAHVLLVVDQFEELFRYKRRNQKDEAEQFVEQLLRVTSDRVKNVYVIITMRSEFMGDCARFEGLAEAVNAGLYLTPRLNRDQLHEAITKPAERCGREIESSLVLRLLNDVANDQDQLPVLQHALMRCWEQTSGKVTENEYTRIGGASALNQHAEDIFKELTDLADDRKQAKGERNARIVSALFRRLTMPANRDGMWEDEPDGRRDPATLDTIYSQTVFGLEEIRPIIERYRKPDCAFLQPSPEMEKELKAGKDGSMIDITHESLIRKWNKLGDPEKGWVREEANCADAFRQLAKAAAEAPEGEDHVLSPREVAQYSTFEKEWSEKWAQRYLGNYKQAIGYLRKSDNYYKEREAAKERRKEAEAAELRRKEKEEAATARRKQEEEAAAALTKKEEEAAKWKERVVWVSVLSLAVALAILGIAFYLRRSLDFADFIQVTNDKDNIMDDRVPAAVHAGSLAKTPIISRMIDEESYLESHVRLDDWELFAAVRKPSWTNLVRYEAKNGYVGVKGGYLRSSGGVSLVSDKTHNLVALANGVSVRIYSLQGPESPIFEDAFEGVERVKFNHDGTRLIVSTSADQDKSAQVNIFRFRNGSWARELPSPIFIPQAVVALSFIDRSKDKGDDSKNEKDEDAVVLTANQLSILRNGELTPASEDLQSAPDKPIQVGIFSADGHYLLACGYGFAWVMDLIHSKRDPLVFQTSDGKPATPSPSVVAGAFSPHDQLIVTGSSDGIITIWKNPPTGDESSVRVGQMDRNVTAVAITDENQKELIAAGSYSGKASVFKKIYKPRPPNKSQKPSRQQDKSVGNSSPQAQQYSQTDFNHQGTVTWISFAQGGRKLITASKDMKARVFDVATGVETARIPHRWGVVFSAATAQGGIVSADQDAVLQFTKDLLGNEHVSREIVEYPCSLKSSQQFAAVSSAVSASHAARTWVLGCFGHAELVVKGKTEPIEKETRDTENGQSLVTSMKFSLDGTALAWVERKNNPQIGKKHNGTNNQSVSEQFLHYAAFDEKRGGWIAARPLPLPTSQQDAVLAMSEDGRVVGTSSEETLASRPDEVKGGPANRPESQSVIILFEKAKDDSVTLKQLLPPISEGGKQTPISLKGEQVISLALLSDKLLAAGTAKGCIVWYANGSLSHYRGPTASDASTGGKSISSHIANFLHLWAAAETPKWKLIQTTNGQASDDETLASPPAVTDVAFIRDARSGVTHLLAATSDNGSVWMLPTNGTSLLIDSEDHHEKTVVRYLAVNAKGNSFAAYDKNSATFFVVDNGGRPIKKVTLQEPDRSTIQSVAFSEKGDTAITSVIVGESITRTAHDLSLLHHLEAVCKNQPFWSQVKAECEEFNEEDPTSR